MVGQETTFVATHAQVVDKERTRCGGVLRGIERRAKGLEQRVDFSVEFADFTYYGAYKLGLVGWQLGECLGSLCMLHLDSDVSELECKRTRRQYTNLLPTSPYIVVMRLGNLSGRADQERTRRIRAMTGASVSHFPSSRRRVALSSARVR